MVSHKQPATQELVSAMFSYVRSQVLEDVSIFVLRDKLGLDRECERVLEQVSSDKIDDVLVSRSPPSLRRIDWVVVHRFASQAREDSFREAVEARLLRCRERGILRVTMRRSTFKPLPCAFHDRGPS